MDVHETLYSIGLLNIPLCLKSNSRSRHILWRSTSFTLHLSDVSENGTHSLCQILIFVLSLMAAKAIKNKGTLGFVYLKNCRVCL